MKNERQAEWVGRLLVAHSSKTRDGVGGVPLFAARGIRGLGRVRLGLIVHAADLRFDLWAHCVMSF